MTELKKCIFCEIDLTGKEKSVEHIIPQWLLDNLQIRKILIDPAHLTSEKVIISKREHTLENFKAGQVCRTCNNGWMSELELEAKPILTDLIHSNRKLLTLSESERFKLARWTVKTAFTLNSGSNYIKKIPNNHYLELFNDKKNIPQKIYCLAQQHNSSQNFNWLQWPIWEINGENISDEEEEIFKNNAYKISFQIKNLILTIFYLDIENYVPVLWKGIHLTLYPFKGKCGWYDKKGFNMNDSINAITDFHVGIKAMKV